MRIVLSRKGFDSASGGVPNPILPDGRLVPLPIPDRRSPIRYADLSWDELDVADVVTTLTGGRIPPTHRAHLDPDLNPTSLPRDPGWTPLFGQDGPAQGHLRNHHVGVGDLFLFFGLFRPTTGTGQGLAWARRSASRHIIWGWLQVGRVIPVDECHPGDLPWARYHPHFHRPPSRSNTLYVAADRLTLPGPPIQRPGGGNFPRVRPRLQLSAPDATRPGDWQLPAWLAPRPGAPAPLTYHGDRTRWTVHPDHVRLSTVGRGQEFVLDTDDYPRAIDWARTIVDTDD